MKILVLGGGGREHAIVDSLCRSGHEVYCHPGNAGTEQIALAIPEQHQAAPIDDGQQMVWLAQAIQVDLCIAGPEAPLAAGVGNVFQAAGIPFFGPTYEGAELEASKAYAKQLMHKYGVPTAASVTCSSAEEAVAAAKEFCVEGTGVVIKPSGLTAGKGVTVCDDLKQAFSAIQTIMQDDLYGAAGECVVVEERMSGQEVSLFCFCDGKRMLPMLPSQDHKRVGDGDVGPNTGGMGAYAPTPFATESVLADIQSQIMDRMQHALIEEGIDYRGVLYIGLMLTPTGPKVVEFNCRFGDPETQAVLPLLTSDLGAICLACANGDLRGVSVTWSTQSACTVVLAAEGYPGCYVKGHVIHGLEAASKNVRVYHAGTRLEGSRVVSSGGRVLAVTGLADSLSEARELAYAALDQISFDGAFCRRDIGFHALAVK